MLKIQSRLRVLYFVILSLPLGACFFSLQGAEPRPNVVLIIGDDVGYNDVSAYGDGKIQTPNLDRLAAGGLRFTDGHCTAATCTPSRYAMLTGVHAFRNNVRILPPNAPMVIPTDVLTLPKLFQQAGYATAFIGKWHLGVGEKGRENDWNGELKPGPIEVGFDLSFSLPYTNDRVPCVYVDGHRVLNLDPADPIHLGKSYQSVNRPGSTLYPDAKQNPEAMTYYRSTHGHNNSVINGIGRIGYMSGGKAALWDDETMTDEFIDRVKTYIAEKKDEPFFLYYASQNIHVPRAPHPRFHGKSGLGLRGDAMIELDWAVGEILDALEAQGIAENTIVIFSSDNGPVYDDGYDDGTTVNKSRAEVDNGHDGSGIWRGGKYQVYEGGTRVPFIISWPARIKPGVSDALVSQIGFVASFAHLLGVELPAGEARDSRNTLDAFLGEDARGLPYMIEEAGVIALRAAEWKYIMPPKKKKKAKPELYNLADDPSETKNIIDAHPEKAAAMAQQLQALIQSNRVRPSDL